MPSALEMALRTAVLEAPLNSRRMSAVNQREPGRCSPFRSFGRYFSPPREAESFLKYSMVGSSMDFSISVSSFSFIWYSLHASRYAAISRAASGEGEVSVAQIKL